MRSLLHNILILIFVLSLTATPVIVYAMPSPAPAAMTDKQKAAEKKKKEQAKQKAAAQKAKEKAAAQKAKEKAAAQKAKEKEKAKADKQKAKADIEKQKAAEARAQEAAAREQEKAKKEAEAAALQEKQVREYEKRQAELENPKPEAISYFNIGLRAGYSAMMDKIQPAPDGSLYGAGTVNQSNPLQQLKGGGGAGLDFSYSLAYQNFMFETGLDFRFLNSTSTYGFQAARTDATYGATYHYWFDNLAETRNMMQVALPIMFGAQFERFYFLLGAKIGYSFWGNYSQKGQYDIVVNDPALLEPYGLGIYSLNGKTGQPIKFAQPEVSLAAEIGIDLDDWLQAEPDPKKKPKVKPGERLPFGREHVHYRVGLFAEYGLLNTNATGAFKPVHFEADQTEVQYTNTMLGMNGNTVLNNLFVGAKFTIQFEVPGKKPRQMTPPASFAYYKVVDANTNQPIQVAFVETTDNNGKIAMREKQIRPNGTKQRHNIGFFTAKAKAEGYYDNTETFEVEKVGINKYITIALRPRPVLRVHVTNMETGQAIPAMVQIHRRDAQEPVYSLQTDSLNGNARQRLEEGPQYSLTIAQMGYETLEMPVNNIGDSLCLALKPIKKGEKFVVKNLHFATNKTRILPSSEEALQALYMYLERNPEVRIRIIGHTDNVGKDAANMKLSDGRANAVMQDLVDRGISADRMQAEGRGETQPIDTNDTEEGRQNNRRVEIEIL